jgi:3-carboxy-cis,cis-muconate cycloisomerase
MATSVLAAPLDAQLLPTGAARRLWTDSAVVQDIPPDATRNTTPDTTPNTGRRAANVAGPGLVHAQALNFARAETMTRPKDQARTKALVADALATDTILARVARAAYPDLPTALFEARAQMGHAPAEARAFANQLDSL